MHNYAQIGSRAPVLEPPNRKRADFSALSLDRILGKSEIGDLLIGGLDYITLCHQLGEHCGNSLRGGFLAVLPLKGSGSGVLCDCAALHTERVVALNENVADNLEERFLFLVLLCASLARLVRKQLRGSGKTPCYGFQTGN